jgi:hypothetical protein
MTAQEARSGTRRVKTQSMTTASDKAKRERRRDPAARECGREDEGRKHRRPHLREDEATERARAIARRHEEAI